jgi:hypothetical protein
MQTLAQYSSSLSQHGITNAIYGLLAESNQGTITIIDVFAEAVRLLKAYPDCGMTADMIAEAIARESFGRRSIGLVLGHHE